MASVALDDRNLHTENHASQGKPADWKAYLAAAIVFLAACFLRLPSCLESLWVDELHSTWTIWGALSDVAPRARMGNQTPYFFWLLWCWQQIFGATEIALRSVSVIFVAGGCSALVLGSYRWRGDLLPGVLAALILTVEKNGLFFGTELRPYGLVICLSSVLLMFAYQRLHGRGIVAHVGFISTACLLFLIHYTAALLVVGVTCGIVLPSIWTSLRRRSLPRFENRKLWRIDVALVLTAAVIVLVLEHAAINDLWQRRQQWEAFALPRAIRSEQPLTVNAAHFVKDFRSMWGWTPMLVLPSGLLILCRLFGQPLQWRRWLPAVAVALLVTLLAYGLSIFEIAALWHRRYIIGALPVLAWGSAELWVAVAQGVRSILRKRATIRRFLHASVFVLAVGSVVIGQGTAQKIVYGDLVLVHRFEDWRAATTWIQEHQGDWEGVLVYAGFIEDALLERPHAFSSERQWERFQSYLCSPANNMYHVNHPIASSANLPKQIAEQWTESFANPSAKPARWWIGRVSWQRHRLIERDLPAWLRLLMKGQPQAAADTGDEVLEIARFGQVSVVHWVGD
ncbi:MAG: glycosyltransferase family 39 protein [Pirellulaceae bacterium]